MDIVKFDRWHAKVAKVIDSCETRDHLRTAFKLYKNFCAVTDDQRTMRDPYIAFKHGILIGRLILKEQQCLDE